MRQTIQHLLVRCVPPVDKPIPPPHWYHYLTMFVPRPLTLIYMKKGGGGGDLHYPNGRPWLYRTINIFTTIPGTYRLWLYTRVLFHYFHYLVVGSWFTVQPIVEYYIGWTMCSISPPPLNLEFLYLWHKSNCIRPLCPGYIARVGMNVLVFILSLLKN